MRNSLIDVVEDAAMAMQSVYQGGCAKGAWCNAGDLIVVLIRPGLRIANLLLDQAD